MACHFWEIELVYIPLFIVADYIKGNGCYYTYQPVKSKKWDKIFEKVGFLVKKWGILKTGLNEAL